MKHQLVVILIISVILRVSEGSQKKDAAPEKEIVLVIQSTTTNQPKQNDTQPKQNIIPSEIILEEDQSSSSSDSKPKVVRHLGPKVLRREKLFLGKMIKRPWFSSKIGDMSNIRILKKLQGGKIEESGVPEIMRYAPRSMDMGLGGLINNYNNLENYYGTQTQAIHPTSGSPNSLDHLYLPEFTAKDYMKPLDFNGIGNLPTHELNNPAPYGEGFGNQGNNNKQNNFRANPIDVNYHNDVGHAGINSMGPSGSRPIHEPYIRPGGGEFPPPPHLPSPPRGNNKASSDQQQNGPPSSPEEHLRGDGKPSNFHKDKENNHPDDRGERGDQNEKSPTGSDEVAGDEGLWGILDLAHILQNSNGLPQQLINAGGRGGGSQKNFSPRPVSGRGGHHPPPPPHFDDDRRSGGNFNPHFDDSGPEGGGSRGEGNHFDGPESDGFRGSGNYNNFDNSGPSGGPRSSGGSKPNHYDTPGFNRINNNGQKSPNSNYGGNRLGPHQYDGPGSDFGHPNRNNNNGYDTPIPENGRPHGNNNDFPIDNDGVNGYNSQYDFHGPNSVDGGGGGNQNNNFPAEPVGFERGGQAEGLRDYPHGGGSYGEYQNDRQRPSRPHNSQHRSPQYSGGPSGFDEEAGSYYNSQEQYDGGPRKPYLQNSEQGLGGVGQESYGGFDK